MTGEKRVLRVGVTNIPELLEAQLQRPALLPAAIGEGLAKRPAQRWQGIGWERCQCARGADFGDQRNGRAPGRRGSRPPAARFGDERRDVGTKSGDRAQQSRRLDRVRTLAAEDVERQGTYPLMGCRKLSGQARMYVRGGEQFADQGDRGNSYHDRGAPIDASRENVLRRVDLRHSDQGNRIAGQDAAVGPVAVQKSTGVDAEPEPGREADHKQAPALWKQPSDHERGDNPDDGGEDPVDGLLVGLPPRRLGENSDGDGGRRGTLELQPERRIQRHHHGGPDSQRESPGGERKPGDGDRARGALREGHGYWCRSPDARLRRISSAARRGLAHRGTPNFSQITVTGAGISAGSNRAPWLTSTLRTSAVSRRPPRA